MSESTTQAVGVQPKHKYNEDEIYPNIAFKFSCKVIYHEKLKGWRWLAELHVEGPDDLFHLAGEPFGKKQAATLDMFKNLKKAFDTLIKRANS